MQFVKHSLIFAILWMLLLFKSSVTKTCRNLSMTPDDPFALVDTSIELCCRTRTGTFSDGETMLVFQCNNTPDVRGHRKTPQLICANISVASRDQTGMCYCEDQHGCHHSKLLTVDDSLAPINATCVVYFDEHWTMSCSWPVPDFRYPEFISTTVKWSLGNGCVFNHGDTEESATCHLMNVCTVDVTDMYNNDYFVNVSFEMTYAADNSSSPQQVITSPWQEFDIHSVVKIGPVHDLKILNSTSTCVTLGWSVFEEEETPNAKLKFQSAWEATPAIIMIQGANIYSLCRLRAFTWYTINITVRLSTSSVWSDSVQIKTKTMADVPLCGPDVTPGAFDILNAHVPRNGKEVAVYWKKPSEIDWLSETDLGYHIYHKNIKEHIWQKTSLDKSVTHWILPIQNDAITLVKIISKNNIGEANCSTKEVVIKVLQNTLLLDVSASWRNGTVQISWNKQNKVNARPTVFWCKRSEQHEICDNTINWTTVNNFSAVAIFLSFSISEAQVHQYGVSLEDVDSKQHSEIIWTTCLKAYKDHNVQNFGLCPHEDVASLDSAQRSIDLLGLVASVVSAVIIVIILAFCIWKFYERGKEIIGTFLEDSRHLLEDKPQTEDSVVQSTLSGDSQQGDKTEQGSTCTSNISSESILLPKLKIDSEISISMSSSKDEAEDPKMFAPLNHSSGPSGSDDTQEINHYVVMDCSSSNNSPGDDTTQVPQSDNESKTQVHTSIDVPDMMNVYVAHHDANSPTQAYRP